MKVKTCISIESEILKTAQELGLNISKFCEYALSQAIRQISNLNFKEGIGNVVSDVVRPPGFEPGSSAWQADVLDQARLRPLSSVSF